jgi:hypothetical protein
MCSRHGLHLVIEHNAARNHRLGAYIVLGTALAAYGLIAWMLA